MTYEEFIANTKKVTEHRNHKVKNSLGIRQAFLYLQSHKWFDIGKRLLEHTFQLIIRNVNKLLAAELIKGNDIKFPSQMGTLELRKFKSEVSIKNGKLVIPNPIDWDATLKLWFEDKEAFNNKQLIYTVASEGYRILYNRAGANYNNKSFYQFTVNREIRKTIYKKLKQGKIEAFYDK